MGSILPFGGETGYRGYALSLLVEILGATLVGHDITVDRPAMMLHLSSLTFRHFSL